ncbi:Helix-turn-helix domain of resolvase [[Flavobacterium] thermophilum]|nr:Helix-turn-helix domain of resolvase [[Flavobacterium] thermophilum]
MIASEHLFNLEEFKKDYFNLKRTDILNKYNLNDTKYYKLVKELNLPSKNPMLETMLSQDELDQVIKMFKEGKSLNEIGRKFGVAGATIKKYLKKQGYEYKAKETNSFDEFLSKYSSMFVYDYFSNRLTNQEIMEKYKITEWIFRRMIDYYKLSKKKLKIEEILTDEQQSNLINDIKSGMYISQLAKKYNVSKDMIKRFAESHQLQLNHFDRKYDINIEEIVDDYVNKNMFLSEIAEKYGCCAMVIKDRLIKHGIEIRDNSENIELLIQKGKFHSGYKGKQIPYKQYMLRSEWELDVAKFLDKYNYKWSYETQTFKLGEFRYTPDFFIYDENGNLQFILEVKGWLKEKDIRKFQLMETLYPEIELILVDRELYYYIKKEVSY